MSRSLQSGLVGALQHLLLFGITTIGLHGFQLPLRNVVHRCLTCCNGPRRVLVDPELYIPNWNLEASTAPNPYSKFPIHRFNVWVVVVGSGKHASACVEAAHSYAAGRFVSELVGVTDCDPLD
ncbi:hypothetical protein D3C81_1585800 [compost metagenome]